MTVINIAKDFTRYPGGRYMRMSKNSGEEFRDLLLLPAIKRGPVTVELDGVRGYGSSFLEEAFGGLVRKMHWDSRSQIDDLLKLVSSSESLLLEISQYIDDELHAQAVVPAG